MDRIAIRCEKTVIIRELRTVDRGQRHFSDSLLRIMSACGSSLKIGFLCTKVLALSTALLLVLI